MDDLSNNQINEKVMHELEACAAFEITPCESVFDFSDSSRFTKLTLTPAQKLHISALTQYIPSAIASGVMSQSYMAKFPEGLPHTLTALSQGGYGSMIRGADGKFVGSASFYAMSQQAALMGAFTAMALVSGQYFLTQINKEMRMMAMELNDILEFLHGDKKAELISEMSFIKYAYQNYSSIMTHEYQRIATISNLQEARKVAMKDIEFYIGKLDGLLDEPIKNITQIDTKVMEVSRYKDELELSQQLFIMSSIMEAYFSQNQDPEYLETIEKEMLAYTKKCNDRLLGYFGELKRCIVNLPTNLPANLLGKMAKSSDENKAEELKRVIDTNTNSLRNGGGSITQEVIHASLYALKKPAECYINSDGEVYMKK